MKKTILLGLVMVWAAAGLAASPLFTLNFNDTNGVSSVTNSGTAGGIWVQSSKGARINTATSPNNTTGYVGAASGGTAFNVTTNTYQFPTVQSFTIGGWICRTGTVTSTSANIFGNNASSNGFGINVLSNNTYRLAIKTGGGQTGFATANGTNKLELGVWTFIAMTYDGTATESNITYYSATSTNALTVGSTVSTNMGDVTAATANLNVGGATVSTYMPGMFDNLRIYIATNGTSGILSQSEITAWMQASDVAAPVSPNVYWNGASEDYMDVNNWSANADGTGSGSVPTNTGAVAVFGIDGLNGNLTITNGPALAISGLVYKNTGTTFLKSAGAFLINQTAITMNSGAGDVSFNGVNSSNRYTFGVKSVAQGGTTFKNDSAVGVLKMNGWNQVNLSSTGLLILDGVGNFECEGPIIGQAGATNNAVIKNGSGTYFATAGAGAAAPNSYLGTTTINAGVFDAAVIANNGVKSGVGAGTNNLIFGGGTLRHSAENVASTDKKFTIGNAVGDSATLDSSSTEATNTLSFTAADLFYGTNSATHRLVLTGSNTGDNTFAPSIATNTVLVKTGAGKWILSGTNTHTGGTIVSNGTLEVNGSIGGTVVVEAGATLMGSGTIGGAATVDGMLNPGNSPGMLTFDETLTLGSVSTSQFEIVSEADFDVLKNDGGDALTFNSGANVIFDFTGNTTVSNGSSFAVLQTWSSIATNGAVVSAVGLSNNLILDLSMLVSGGLLKVQSSEQYTTNGTPYSWLAGYGLTNYVADDVLDQDTDGLKTWQEYIAGTVPTNPASSFKVAQATRNTVTWSLVSTGRVYSVYWSTNLVKGFTNLASNIVHPQGSWTNTAPDAKVNHYQVRVKLQ